MAANNTDFCIYYQNTRGLRTKLNTLYMSILSNSFDVVILTETWLIPTISNSEFIDDRYVVFRCDRNRTATGKRDGGGVLIAVLRKYNPVCVSFQSQNFVEKHFEQVVITIPSHNNTAQTLISAVYIPNNSQLAVYNMHFDLMDNLINSGNFDNVLLLGDYNIPMANWMRPHSDFNSFTCTGNSAICNRLRNFMTVHDVLQYNHLTNTYGRTLDLLIANTNCFVYKPKQDLVQADNHHPPFYTLLSLNIKLTRLRPLSTPRYNFRKADYILINKDIDEIDWDLELGEGTPEKNVEVFYDHLYGIIKNRVPLSKPKNSKFPVWFSKSLMHIFNYKKKAWTKWKTYQNISDYEIFALYRERFKSECIKCYRTYMNSVEDGIPKNVKHFWAYIAGRKGKSGIPSKMYYKDETTSDAIRICNLFSSFFQSVYEPSSLTPNWSPGPDQSDVNNTSLCNLHFSLSLICKQLQMLDINKGPGPDGIPPCFLKWSANTLCKPLYKIFNQCISNGSFPSVWKKANIIPVYKGGPRQNIENYRPISLLCSLAKVFEKLVHHEIYPFVQNCIISEQHGFVKRKSTVTNLMIFTSHLFKNIDARAQTDTIYTDFRKAFDRVDHKILLSKISFNGIRGNLLRWFMSYISNRSQTIVTNGYYSNTYLATSGVPQGSILGPLMFIIYINDICSCFKNCNFLLYADDLKIFKKITSINDCYLLQDDLNRLSNYCTENKLELSITKCKHVPFTKTKQIINYNYNLCGELLQKETQICDLGVLLDSKLHLNLHIEKIVAKAFQMYNFVMRSSSNFKRPATYLHLFNFLIRPQVEYACMIWDPYYAKYDQALERIQRKFLKAVQFKCRLGRLPYDESLQKFKLLTLHSRRLLLQAMMLCGLIHNRFDCPELVNNLCYVVPRTVIRRGVCAYPVFATTTCRTNAGERAPLHRLVKLYNQHFVNIDIFALSHNVFKKKLVNTLAPYKLE